MSSELATIAFERRIREIVEAEVQTMLGKLFPDAETGSEA